MEEEMNHKHLIVILTVLCCLSLACNLITTSATNQPDQQPINVETSVAGTLAFESAVLTAAAGQLPAPTDQAAAPTSEPPAATVEPTSSVPMISASMDTNCRTGPSTVYEAISYLLVGKTSEVVNQYQNGLWWVIKDPNEPNRRCWVWGSTTSVTGNWQQLPEATQPPTPTINLSLQPELTSITPSAFLGLCPAVLTLEGKITSNMAISSVSYVWARTSGPNIGSGWVAFTGAGTQTFSRTVTFLGPSSGDISIRIVSPITVTSNSLHYTVHCTP
jgi:hypothetical protein